MRPFRIFKIAWFSFSSLLAGLVALVGIVVYGMYYLEDPTKGEFLRNLVFDERAYEVTVDLVADGEPLTITRTINCVPYFRTGEFRFGQSWKPTLESFGKRLKSDHAVIVATPSLCHVAELSFWEKSRAIPINDDYIPFFRWVDSTDRPTLVEDYIGRDYFKQPGARIQYRNMSVRAVPYQSSAMDFEGLDGVSRPFRKRDSGAAYGYVAWPITEKEWSADQVIAEEVQSIEAISELPLELTRRLNGKFPPNIDYGTVNGGYGLVPGPRATGRGDYRRVRRDPNDVVPLFFYDDAFELDERNRGYLILYPIASNSPDGNDPLVMRLRINEQTMAIEFAGFSGVTTIYVPETKTIYQLQALWKGVPNIAEN
jgi:hypothetical protein